MIGTDGPGSTCDPAGLGPNNIYQLCGANFTADPGNPGPYTTAYYQALDSSACPVAYTVGSLAITSTDTPAAFGSPTATPSNGPCPMINGQEAGPVSTITGTHSFSAPGAYTVTTAFQYLGPGCPCPRSVQSVGTFGPGLTVSKAGPSTGTVGQAVTYTFTVTNNAANTAYAPVTLTDVLPSTVVFIGASPGCTVSGQDPITGAGGTVTCPVADSLAPSGSMTVGIVVLPTTDGPITNGAATATGTAAVPGGTSTTSPPSNTVTTAVATQCSVTTTGPVAGNITVLSGTRLCLTNANVAGSINVKPGGALVVTNSTIGGAIISDGATAFSVCGSTVNGSVNVAGTTGAVRLGTDAADPVPCASNTFRSGVTVEHNTGGVDVIGNTIGGPLSVKGNTGLALTEGATVEVETNTITGALLCSGNTPGVTNDGAPNRASVKTGQCTAL